jgi:hypothetical protein
VQELPTTTKRSDLDANVRRAMTRSHVARQEIAFDSQLSVTIPWCDTHEALTGKHGDEALMCSAAPSCSTRAPWRHGHAVSTAVAAVRTCQLANATGSEAARASVSQA